MPRTARRAKGKASRMSMRISKFKGGKPKGKWMPRPKGKGYSTKTVDYAIFVQGMETGG